MSLNLEALSKEYQSVFRKIANQLERRVSICNDIYDKVNNATIRSRGDLMTSDNPDPRRDFNREFGYPTSISSTMYQNIFDRSGIAYRLISMLAEDCWKASPNVYEDENPEVKTLFEETFYSIGKRLRGETSYYDTTQEGNPLWSILKKLDITSGIGEFGIAVLGFDDGETLDTPIEGFEEEPNSDLSQPYADGIRFLAPFSYPREGTLTKTRNLIYIRVFPQTLVSISEFDQRSYSPRYGEPLYYEVHVANPRVDSETFSPTNTYRVHWSRVIHVPSDNDRPRLENVYNYVLNLEKLLGGSAEMYWLGAFPGIQVSTHPNLGTEVDVDTEATKDELELFMNGMQRFFILTGMDAKTLAPTVVSPEPQINVQIAAICAAKEIPLNIFLKGRVGEPTQDGSDEIWDEKIKGRQKTHIIPNIIIPVIDRFINVGVLPKPEKWGVYWNNMHTKTDAEKASNAMQRTQALVTYANSKASMIVSPMDYLVRFLWFTEEEAETIIDNAESFVSDMDIPKGALINDSLLTTPDTNKPDLKNDVALPKGSGANNDGKVILPSGDTTTGKNTSTKSK